jgi:hypothetical protein
MRSGQLLLGMILAGISSNLAAQAKPDFSGTWTNTANDPPNLTEMNIVTGVRGMRSCETFTIEHDERTLTIVSRPPGESQPVRSSHALDGSDRTDTTRRAQVTSRAAWRGDEVVLTMLNRKMLREEDITQVIRLSPDGKLTVTTSTTNRVAPVPPATKVFEKMDVRQCKQLEFERFRSRPSDAGSQSTASTASAVETIAPSNQLGVAGVYVGTYQCAQGSTRLTLTVTERLNGFLSALFTFYPPTPVAGATADHFSFRLQGRYNPKGATRLSARSWDVRPPARSGFAMVGMLGQFDPDKGTFSGNISGRNCGAFSVTRDAGQSAELLKTAAAADASRAARPPAASRSTASAPTTEQPKPSTALAKPATESPFATDPRLSAVPADVRDLVLDEVNKVTPYCEGNQTLGRLYECPCVAKHVLDYRVDTKDFALAPATPSDIRQNRTPPPRLQRTFTLFFLAAPFNTRLAQCVSRPKVEKYAREYVERMASTPMSPLAGAQECAVAGFVSAFTKDSWPDASYVSKLMQTAMLACTKKR